MSLQTLTFIFHLLLAVTALLAAIVLIGALRTQFRRWQHERRCRLFSVRRYSAFREK